MNLPLLYTITVTNDYVEQVSILIFLLGFAFSSKLLNYFVNAPFFPFS